MKNLIIVGAGEFGRELYWTILESIGYSTEFEVKGYLDDGEPAAFTKLQRPLLGTTQGYEMEKDDVFTCAVANPLNRQRIVDYMLSRGAEFVDIIHKTAIIQGSVQHGEGLIMCPFTALGDSSVIGNHVMINTFSAVGHDSRVDDFTCIMAHCDITGHANIGKRVFIGGGAGTVPYVNIGDDAYVGAGSIVLRKVKPGVKVFGNPAVEI